MNHPTAARLALRGRASVAAVSALLVLSAIPMSVAAVGIVFDGSPGTNPPPATLGGYPMTPFGPDGYVDTQVVAGVPTPGGGTVGFTPSAKVFAPASSLLGGWTAGYTGNAYIVDPATTTPALTMTMPANTKAFYFYAEPNWCGSYTFTATADDGTTSGPIPIPGTCSGPAAKYFGFYTTGSTTLVSIGVTGGGPDTSVVVGQFAIFVATKPSPPTGVAGTPGNGQASVAFTPGGDGGSPILGYDATCTSSNGGATGTASGAGSPILVTGLTNGKTYTCTVTATNALGTSDPSAPSASFTLASSVPSPAATPQVVGFSPGAGKVGSLVTILGTSFSYANKVTFNGIPALFVVKTPGTIVATVPRGATTGPIRVTTPFGSGVSARSFFVLP